MTVIEVVLDLENHGPTPIVLSRVRLDSALARGTAFANLEPARVEGGRTIAPRSEQRVHAFFMIPGIYDPEDIQNFQLGWELRHPGGTYAERTPFQKPPRADVSYPYPPFSFSYPCDDTFVACSSGRPFDWYR
jgi:hypothetical protein